MTIRPTFHRSCHFDYFTDAAGELCIISEGTGNNPLLFLGLNHQAMMLTTRHAYALLPHLHRFAHTGLLVAEPQADYEI